MDNTSKPKYDVILDRKVRIKMSDGEEIAGVLVRPSSKGTFPGIVEYTPYRRLNFVNDGVSEKDYNHRWHGPAWFAQRGYAVIMFDVRGTGNSSGFSKDIYSERERTDAYEVVDWIANQPWCNGKVGMWGMSYGGVVQWQTAVKKPPQLKTLVMGSSNTDIYLDWTNPGGSIRPYMFDSFSPMMTAYNFAPPDCNIVGPLWEKLWKERLKKNEPWGIGYIKNILQGDYWKDRSLEPDYSRIQIPVLFWCGWGDPYPTPILRAFSKLKVPKKIIMGPWGHYWPEEALPGPRIDFRYEMLKWYDHWLKEIDNDVMKQPQISLFIRKYKKPLAHMFLEDAGFWRSENEWPPKRNIDTPFYFHSIGKLSTIGHKYGDEANDKYVYNPSVGITTGIYWGGGIMPWAMPVDQRLDEALSLTYTTPPFEEDVEITGNPSAILFLASSAKTAYFHVKISDVAIDGTSKWLTDGGILGTHRKSHSDPEALIPDKIFELKISLKYVSYIIAKGHRLRISISSADFQNAWPTGESAVNTLYRDKKYPSHVVLPITPTQNSLLPMPDFKPSPQGPATKNEVPKNSRYEITHDFVKDKVRVKLHRDGFARAAIGLAESTYSVSPKNPSETEINARFVYDVPNQEKVIIVESNENLHSDKKYFHFSSKVEVTVGGKLFFEKSWKNSVPRKLS